MRKSTTVGGVTYGIFSGIFWAVDTVLIGIVLSMTGFLKFEELLFVAPLISTFLHDTFSAIWMTVYLASKGEYTTAISSLKRKPGRIVILAGKFLLFSDGFIIQYFFPDYKSEITVCNYRLYNHYPPAKWEKMVKNRV